jgi:hypothetical protein
VGLQLINIFGYTPSALEDFLKLHGEYEREKKMTSFELQLGFIFLVAAGLATEIGTTVTKRQFSMCPFF